MLQMTEEREASTVQTQNSIKEMMQTSQFHPRISMDMRFIPPRDTFRIETSLISNSFLYLFHLERN